MVITNRLLTHTRSEISVEDTHNIIDALVSRASSQNLIKATADVILFPQIKRNFFKYCKYLY